VAQLEQSVLAEDVGSAGDGGGVDADGDGGEGVDTQEAGVKVGFTGAEGIVVGDAVEAVGQSVIREMDGSKSLSQESGECELVLLGPGFDVVEAVIRLGEEVADADGEDVSRGEGSVPSGGGGKCFSRRLRNLIFSRMAQRTGRSAMVSTHRTRGARVGVILLQ
jgi:hypothetical protein